MDPLRPDLAHQRLLRAALLDEPSAKEAWSAWCGDDSKELVDASSWRLLPLLHGRLSGPSSMLSSQATPSAQAMAQRARTAFEQTRYRNALLFDEAGEALSVLRQAGIAVCLLKGAALCATVYADAALRPMSDVDFLVRPRDLQRTIDALRAAGWTSPSPLGPLEIAESHSAPFTNETRGSIDLHWRALDTRAPADGDVSLWDLSLPGRFAGEEVRIPCAADLLLHACVGGRRFEGDAACRWVADALATLAASDPDWSRFAQEASRHGESLGVADSIEYLRTGFGAKIPVDVILQLRSTPTTRADAFASRAREVIPEARGPLMAIALHMDIHRRQVLRGAASPGLLGFARTVARTWGVPSVWLLPFHAAGRGMRRLFQMARSGLRARHS